MTVRWPALFACALCLAIGCTKDQPTGPAANPVIESGLLAAAEGTALRVDRSKPDVAGAGWVTGYAAEAAGDPGAAWRSDLRLTNGTRLLVASSAVPEVRFPAGFALPLAEILDDMPEAWRGAQLVSSGSATVEKVRWRIDALPATTQGLKRLYLLELAAEHASAIPEPSSWWSGTSLAGSEWPLAAGKQVVTHRITKMPVDATVHAASALGGDYLTSIRFRDVTAGKLLWEATPAAGATRRIEPYHSASGFVLAEDHEYEIEAAFDVPEGATALGSAVLFLYYHLPDEETVSYPFPPADE
jgi:hypothetical protein